MSYVPFMIDLHEVPVLVVGGGRVAERKIGSLLKGNAKVTVISPVISGRIKRWQQDGKIDCRLRKYVSEDAGHYRMIVAATNDPAVNDQVAFDAKSSNVWVNVAGDQRLSTMVDPASFTRGKLCISVSTNGASPALASKIKKELAERYGDEYEEVLDFLYTLRLEVKSKFADDFQRKQILKYMAEIDWIEQFRSGTLERSIPKWLAYFEQKCGS